MKVLIIGGGGMVGQKLARLLASDPLSGGDEVTLLDMALPENGAPAARRVEGNVTDQAMMVSVAAERFDLVYHLAAIVSGEAEANFDLGWNVNMVAFRGFLEAFRAETAAADGTYRPKIIFTSSIAVFGPPFPEKIGDDFPTMPRTSYGAQKAISELMLGDYIRKGFFDGMSIRLPTICVRPGKANGAASSFFSGIIREPLSRKQAILPVSDTVRHWHASPRSAAGFLRHAATLDLDRLGGHRELNMPGVSCTVAEQIEALRDVAGESAVSLIRPEPDETIMKIVAGWPRNFAPERAIKLGFAADPDFASIVQTYIEEDMPAA
ncbi:MAG: SDR family oxidoreductase [Boseongicola sp. SB0677_bin_26]|nr:SDR family oxidoreductase [Boseongicola sp. SB0665_bin_10]MYG25835.1 SDR family oxidoreductase [Boseongicola sp. SB0677_bin_26]